MPNWSEEQFAAYQKKRSANSKNSSVQLVSGGVDQLLVGSKVGAMPDLPALGLPIRAENTDALKLNKTERAYYEWLKLQGLPWIGVQCITLKLADDTRYSPDFWVLNEDGSLTVKEVKGGFFRDDAKVKIKVAARMYPFFKFQVVTKHGVSGWLHTPVKP